MAGVMAKRNECGPDLTLSRLPTQIVSRKVLTPGFGVVIGQDRYGAFEQNGAGHFAAEPVGPACWRANGQDDAFLRDAADSGESPVNARTDDQPRPDRQFIERYLSFGRFHDFWRLA